MNSKKPFRRCAQPLTGFSARCVEDEKLMELIAGTNEAGGELLLVDTRPMVREFAYHYEILFSKIFKLCVSMLR